LWQALFEGMRDRAIIVHPEAGGSARRNRRPVAGGGATWRVELMP
jgi:hypothetical protein